MKEETKYIADLFVKNYHSLRKAFKWTDEIAKRMSAYLFAIEGKEVDIEAIKAKRQLIKSRVGAFSAFRGTSEFSLASLLAIHKERDDLFDRTKMIYDRLKRERMRNSDYLVLSAYTIALLSNDINADQAVLRTREYYQKLKNHHSVLAGTDDYVTATLVGVSSKDIDQTILDTERLYEMLKSFVRGSSGALSLAQLLVIQDVPHTQIDRFEKINALFREQGYKVHRQPGLYIPALLMGNAGDERSLVQSVIDVHNAIRSQPGFGVMRVSQNELLLYAASIVSTQQKQSINPSDTLPVSAAITSVLIAQMTAMIVAAVIVPTMVSASSGQ